MASSLDNQFVPGSAKEVSCLTSKLCVVVGSNKGVGDVVDLSGGKPGKPLVVKGSRGLYAIDCPAPAGCIALGSTSSSTDLLIVEINSQGRVAGSRSVPLPSGMSLTALACRSLFACDVWGSGSLATSKGLEFGQWDGRSFRFEHVGGPSASDRASVNSVSCYSTTCVAVGTAQTGTGGEGFVVSTTGRLVSRTWTVSASSLDGVACTSATLCYAAGHNQSGGVVVTLEGGVPGPMAIAPSDPLSGIACGPSSCVAVGQEPEHIGLKSTHYGTLVGVAIGAVASTQLVPSSAGFISVAAPLFGPNFTALGRAQHSGYEVSTLS
jgi:hypothetical protein